MWFHQQVKLQYTSTIRYANSLFNSFTVDPVEALHFAMLV